MPLPKDAGGDHDTCQGVDTEGVTTTPWGGDGGLVKMVARVPTNDSPPGPDAHTLNPHGPTSGQPVPDTGDAGEVHVRPESFETR